MRFLILAAMVLLPMSIKAQTPGCGDRKIDPAPTAMADYFKTIYKGYRVALASDFASDWCGYYKAGENPQYISADYDGDGKNEHAFILTTKTHSKYVIVVLDELETGEMKPYRLADWDAGQTGSEPGPLIFGLKNGNPGKLHDHETGKDISVATPYITQYYFGKAAVSYYWTGKGYRKVDSAD